MKVQEAATAISDETLLARIAARDEAAFAILLDRHLENVRGLAWRLLASHSDIDDIAQDIFLKLWSKPQSFKAGSAKFSTWLYRVTLNACIDRKRRHANRPHDEIDDTIPDTTASPEAIAISNNRAERVQLAIDKLPERQRQAIALSHFQDLGNIEAAKVMDTSVEAMESLLGRARRSLKQMLAKDVEELLEGTN